MSDDPHKPDREARRAALAGLANLRGKAQLKPQFVAAEPNAHGSGVYKRYKHPAYPGQTRVAMWRYLIEPEGPRDPTWTDRARKYWGQQMDLYGVTFTAFWIEIDRDMKIVKTFAVVGEILPGRRESHHADELPRAEVLMLQ